MVSLRSAVVLIVASTFLALAGCGSGGSGGGSTDNSRTVQSVAVSPTVTVPIPVGLTQQLAASAYFSDGTGEDVSAGVTWSSDDESVATVDSNGLVTAVSAGEATISAKYSGTMSGGTVVTITAATLDSISLQATVGSLAAGLSTNLTVQGSYSDGTTSDLTAGATFTADDSGSFASIAGSVLSAVAAGTVNVTAHYGGKDSAAVPVTVTAASLQSISLEAGAGSIALGLTTGLTVTGNYSDGTSVAIASGVNFGTSGAGSASVSAAGLVTGLGVGNVTITATYGGKSDSVVVGVSSAVLQSLSLQAASGSIIAGLGTQLTVLGNYSDGTSVQLDSGVTFSSNNLGIATVSSLGLVNGIGAGSATVSATYGGKSASTSIAVSAAILDHLVLDIGNASLAAGLTTQLTVTAVYSDESEVTLSSGVAFSVDGGHLGLVSVNSSGLVSAIATTGTAATITASYSGQTATANVSVTSALLQSISVDSVTSLLDGLPLGLTAQLVVTGHYSDASTATLSSGVTFTSLTTALASVTSGGLVSSVAVGSAHIKASYGGQDATFDLTTTNPTLTSITATPGTTSLNLLNLLTTQITVTGHYSNGTSAVIPSGSSGLSFTSSNNSKLSVLLSGLATALGVGTNLTITASYGGFTDATPPITITLL